MIYSRNNKKGFTLIELLIVIAIIGILASIVLVSLNSARLKARDAKRLQEIKSIQTALEVYYIAYGQYPDSDYDGCGGWDIGNQSYPFISNLASFLGQAIPRDPIKTGNCDGYRYYRYGAGSYGCDINSGAFYVLGITDMEGSGNPANGSPGWSCSGRDWQGEMEWVTGKFENK